MAKPTCTHEGCLSDHSYEIRHDYQRPSKQARFYKKAARKAARHHLKAEDREILRKALRSSVKIIDPGYL